MSDSGEPKDPFEKWYEDNNVGDQLYDDQSLENGEPDIGIMKDNRLIQLGRSNRLIDNFHELKDGSELSVISLSMEVLTLTRERGVDPKEQAHIALTLLIGDEDNKLFFQSLKIVEDGTIVMLENLLPSLIINGVEVKNRILFEVLEVDQVTGVMVGPHFIRES